MPVAMAMTNDRNRAEDDTASRYRDPGLPPCWQDLVHVALEGAGRSEQTLEHLFDRCAGAPR